LREIKAIEYTCGLSAVAVGLGLYSYYVRELLASLVLFTGAFFILGLVAFGLFLIYCAGQKVAIWAPPASRSMVALSRRLMAAYARS
jgi:integral membrane sensor domain MASE1